MTAVGRLMQRNVDIHNSWCFSWNVAAPVSHGLRHGHLRQRSVERLAEQRSNLGWQLRADSQISTRGAQRATGNSTALALLPPNQMLCVALR